MPVPRTPGATAILVAISEPGNQGTAKSADPMAASAWTGAVPPVAIAGFCLGEFRYALGFGSEGRESRSDRRPVQS